MTAPSEIRRAVVISCDRWHIDFLGCYGNDWIETPALQRLAATGVVFDRCFAASPDLEWVARSWWTGRRQSRENATGSPHDWSIGRLTAAGVRTVLFVESSEVPATEVAPPFEEIITVAGRDDLDARESEIPFARLVAQVENWLRDNAEDVRPTLLWFKCRGTPIPWLPPRGFADLYLEDFGLTAASGVEGGPDEDLDVPSEFPDDEVVDLAEEQDLSAEMDRQALDNRYALAMYASYVSVLDRWLGRLEAAFQRSEVWRNAATVFTAAAGAALESAGTEEEISESDRGAWRTLRGELIHTPLIVRLPDVVSGDRSHGGTRRSALVESTDLAPTLFDWFGVAWTGARDGASLLPVIRQQVEEVHDCLPFSSGAVAALRTDDYLYIEAGPPHDEDESCVRLFEKPFDRWDVNDVSAGRPDVVDELRRKLHELQAGSRADPNRP